MFALAAGAFLGGKVFISYSRDSLEHRERVLALADRLRQVGIDVRDHSEKVTIPVPEVIVPLSLGYAAEGRAVAATMTNAVPLTNYTSYCTRFRWIPRSTRGLSRSTAWWIGSRHSEYPGAL